MSPSVFAGPLGPQCYVVNEDREAMQLAMFFGMLGELNDPGTPGHAIRHAFYYDHPTHWMTCSRCWRHPDPKENGWCFAAWPKNGETPEQFVDGFLQRKR